MTIPKKSFNYFDPSEFDVECSHREWQDTSNPETIVLSMALPATDGGVSQEKEGVG